VDSPTGAGRQRIVFISSNSVWGGSEELWSAAAEVLAEGGHAVAICKTNLDLDEPRLHRLRALKCPMIDLARVPGFSNGRTARLLRASSLDRLYLHFRLRAFLRRFRPALAVVSQGGNHDGLGAAASCRRAGVPFALIAQKADDMYWPLDAGRDRMRSLYAEARAAYFVSEHNRAMTEEQIGAPLPHAEVVRNPYLVPRGDAPAWPSTDQGLRLACVGRLYIKEKGQDLLLRVLSRPHWRERNLSVTFFGNGPNAQGLADMARYLRLSSVTFGGFVRDVPAIWRDHHGLVLPSRCEGLPLVVVEAMMTGRVPILTAVGGNTEVVDDNQTGFLAAAPTEDALDEAMTRAWDRRAEWPAIGAEAARRIRALVPESPQHVLADRILALCRPAAGPT
jgi:glycosyltransferase involved in cell wall biosynthesis